MDVTDFTLSLPGPAKLPRFAVYAFFDAAGNCTYVGCTGNLINRLGAHAAGDGLSRRLRLTDEIVEIRVWAASSRSEAVDREREMICHLQPRDNVVGTHKAKLAVRRNGGDRRKPGSRRFIGIHLGFPRREAAAFLFPNLC